MLKVSRKDKLVKAILAATYPEWKGRKISVAPAVEYQMMDYWSEGSRCYIKAYDLRTGKAAEPTGAARNPFRDDAHARVQIPEGIVFVEHAIFCGKDAGVRILANPANVALNVNPTLEGAAKLLQLVEAKALPEGTA